MSTPDLASRSAQQLPVAGFAGSGGQQDDQRPLSQTRSVRSTTHEAPMGTRAVAIVTKTSPWSVEETVNRLSAVVAARGMQLFAIIDHSGEAEAVGLELRNTKLVIFGSAQAGTPVMQAAPIAALDLPLKVLVWADGHETKLSYTAPEELVARYGLSPEFGERLTGINAVTNAVIDR